MDLPRAEHLINWARMDFKPAKSRSLGVKKGKVKDQFRFSLGDIQIPPVVENPVKSLGKIYNCTLKDTAALQTTTNQLVIWWLWTSQVCQVNLKPGSSSTASCPNCSGHCWSMMCQLPSLRH